MSIKRLFNYRSFLGKKLLENGKFNEKFQIILYRMEQEIYKRNLSWIYLLQMKKIRAFNKNVQGENKGQSQS